VTEDWKSKLYQVTNKYPLSNQFNADETELFDQHMPRKSLIQKGEKCKGGKQSKERLFSVVVLMVKSYSLQFW
jgi:hypothetical protein